MHSELKEVISVLIIKYLKMPLLLKESSNYDSKEIFFL